MLLNAVEEMIDGIISGYNFKNINNFSASKPAKVAPDINRDIKYYFQG